MPEADATNFPPARDALIHDDVKALFKLVGIRYTWLPEWLAFRIDLGDNMSSFARLADVELVGNLESAQQVVYEMIANVNNHYAR